MRTLEELNRLDDTLGVQLRLALASPLWKDLPYLAQVNPRTWRLEVLEVRPGRRLTVQAAIPWRTPQSERPPLNFLIVIWHNRRGGAIHHHLAQLNSRRRPARRVLFYDALSHALVCQFRPRRQPTPEGAWFEGRWVRRLIRSLSRRLRD